MIGAVLWVAGTILLLTDIGRSPTPSPGTVLPIRPTVDDTEVTEAPEPMADAG